MAATATIRALPTPAQTDRTPVRLHFPKKFADDHHLLSASKKFSPQRFMHVVNGRNRRKNLEGSGETAYKRILEYALDLKNEYVDANEGKEYGWIKIAAERMGIKYTTLWNIVDGSVTRVASSTVDRIAKRNGIPIAIFYDPEL
jgi:hypothetical protein